MHNPASVWDAWLSRHMTFHVVVYSLAHHYMGFLGFGIWDAWLANGFQIQAYDILCKGIFVGTTKFMNTSSCMHVRLCLCLQLQCVLDLQAQTEKFSPNA